MTYRRMHAAILILVLAGLLLAVRAADAAPYAVTLSGTAFAQIDDGLVIVDFRPGIPAWVARQAAGDFTRTFALVSADLQTTYPPGPYRLLLYRTMLGYAAGLIEVQDAPCGSFVMQTHAIVPMGDQVLGLPVTSQGLMDFLIGHEVTDALVAYAGGKPFGSACTSWHLLTPWVNDGFADYIGDQIGGQAFPFEPVERQVGHMDSVAFARSSGTSILLGTDPGSVWSQGYYRPGVSALEYAVADEMVRAVLARGGMALFRRVVVADGAGRPLAPVLGETPAQLAQQAWVGYQRWYAGHRWPAAYFAPSTWVWLHGRIVREGGVFAFGLKPGESPHVAVDGVPLAGTVAKATQAGLFFMWIPAGAHRVTVDGLRAAQVTAPLARRLLAGLGQT